MNQPLQGQARVGVIGLGNVGAVHLAAYQAVTSAVIVAAADIDQQRGQALAAKYGIKSYPGHLELLDNEALDLACVLTPPASHLEVVTDCAKRGVNVLCEKPIASTLAEGRQLIAACESSGVRLFYGASYRFLPALVRAAELIRSGAIGDVLILREQVIAGCGIGGRATLGAHHYPKGGPGGSGMGLVDHGVHLIDAFRWLTGSEISSVIGRGNITGAPQGPEFMLMNFASGALGQLLYEDGTFSTDLPGEGSFSWGGTWDIAGQYMPPGGWDPHPGVIHVHGSKGALRIAHYANALYVIDAEGMRQVALDERAPPLHFASQLDAAVRCLHGETTAIAGADEALKALQALDAVYASEASGRVIQVANLCSTSREG